MKEADRGRLWTQLCPMSPAQVSVNLEGASHIALQKQLPGPTTVWTYCWWWDATPIQAAQPGLKTPKQKLFVLLQLQSMGSTTQGHPPPPLSFLPIHTSTVQPVSERWAVDVWIKAGNSMGRKRKTSRESWKLKCDPQGTQAGPITTSVSDKVETEDETAGLWQLVQKNWIQKVVSLNSIGYHIPQVWLCRFELELQIAPT